MVPLVLFYLCFLLIGFLFYLFQFHLDLFDVVLVGDQELSLMPVDNILHFFI